MNNKLAILLGLALVVLFGCVEIETNHKQNSDGSAVITQVVDMSAYMEMANSYNEDDTFTVNTTGVEEICPSIPSDVECTYDEENWIVTLTMEVSADDAFYTFEKSGDFFSTKYKLVIDEFPDFGYIGDDEEEGFPNGKFTSEENAEKIANMLMVQGKWTYTVEMPGKIKNAEGAEIDGNKAEFDLLEIAGDGDKLIVESEESLLSCLPIFAFLLLPILVFISRD